MAYLAEVTYEKIRNDPSMVITYYNATRTTFIADLAATGVTGLTEDAYKAAWCTMVAYGLVPYGPGPASTDLTLIINSETIACAHYVSLSWQLIELFGIATTNQTAVGWDDGAVGNHAQMLFDDGTSRLLLDPTIGLIVKDVTLEALIKGVVFTEMKSFYSRDDISSFNTKVQTAVENGAYKVWDAIYYIPTLDNWLNHNQEFRGLSVEHGGKRTIVGYLYDDVLAGGRGNDILYGGKGNDKLMCFVGSCTAYGGKGDDVCYINDQSDIFVERVDQGHDTVRSAISYTLPSYVEDLVLLYSVRYGTGNSSANKLVGNSDINVLAGLSGNDKLYGKDGADSLSGGAGQDVLDGGPGADVLKGGGGADSFIWRSTADSGFTTNSADLVVDFNRIEGDRLSLSLIDANSIASGNQAFNFIGGAAFTAPGQVRTWYSTNVNETLVLLNTDSDSQPEAFIRLAGSQTLASDWFLL